MHTAQELTFLKTVGLSVNLIVFHFSITTIHVLLTMKCENVSASAPTDRELFDVICHLCRVSW